MADVATRAVWKYTLRPMICCQQMPTGARLLTVAAQGDDLCVWVEVDPDAAPVTRRMEVFPTGVPIPGDYDWEYVGTVHMPGPLVFHVYDGGEC